MKPQSILLALLILCSAWPCSAQTVSIGGNKFYVNGNEIFFNGINTAWQPQSDYSLDFLGRNFDYNWWNNEFQRYADNRINLARIWIHGAGNYSPSLNGDGMVTGASSAFWSQMDQLVALAREKKIYIMPTFWSFDMVKDQGSWYYNQYRQIINDPNKTQWYIDHFLRPFLQRYENEPYVMGYDICNEPEHMWRDANCGNLPRNNVVRFVARCAAAINQYSNKPVTVGSMWIIFNSNRFAGWDTYAGNNYSNASLQAQHNSPYAYLDFWSPHWYQWQSSGGPFDTSVGFWLDNGDRPVLIGETPGYDINSSTWNNCCNWNISMATTTSSLTGMATPGSAHGRTHMRTTATAASTGYETERMIFITVIRIWFIRVVVVSLKERLRCAPVTATKYSMFRAGHRPPVMVPMFISGNG